MTLQDHIRELLKGKGMTIAALSKQSGVPKATIYRLLRGIGGEFLTDVVTEEKVQGRIVRTVRPRHDAVTSHTARRSAITYWANKGRTLTWIKKMSGHSGLRSLEKYIIDEEDD